MHIRSIFITAALLAVQIMVLMAIRPTELGTPAFITLCVVSGLIAGVTYSKLEQKRKALELQFQILLSFVKVVWEDNPILANALWRKSYPGVNPPWQPTG